MLLILSFFIILQMEDPESQLMGMVDVMLMPGKNKINVVWQNAKSYTPPPSMRQLLWWRVLALEGSVSDIKWETKQAAVAQTLTFTTP